MKLLQLFKKEKVDEFKDIQNQIWYNIHCVGRDWNKDDIIITRDTRTICVGQFSSYDVFIPTNYISFRELVKIKYQKQRKCLLSYLRFVAMLAILESLYRK